MSLVLYVAKGTVSVAPHIALEELGVAHRLVWLDFASKDQQTAEYLALNAKGRVPTLITDHGPVTETPAILAYLAATHPEAGLMPDAPFQRAKVDELATYLASTVHVNHAHKMRGPRWSDDPAAWESMTAKVQQNMADSFALIEAQMGDGPWVMGDAYSMVDMYLFTVARWLKADGVEISTFPRVAAHSAAMLERPAVQRTMALHQ